MTSGNKAVLTIDVWEHAYYVDKRNARPAYIESWWNLVNWDYVNSQLEGWSSKAGLKPALLTSLGPILSSGPAVQICFCNISENPVIFMILSVNLADKVYELDASQPSYLR